MHSMCCTAPLGACRQTWAVLPDGFTFSRSLDRPRLRCKCDTCMMLSDNSRRRRRGRYSTPARLCVCRPAPVRRGEPPLWEVFSRVYRRTAPDSWGRLDEWILRPERSPALVCCGESASSTSMKAWLAHAPEACLLPSRRPLSGPGSVAPTLRTNRCAIVSPPLGSIAAHGLIRTSQVTLSGRWVGASCQPDRVQLWPRLSPSLVPNRSRPGY